MKQHFRGSILVYTLFILGIALVGVLSLASVMLVQERSGLNTQDSIQSFQVANSGVERALATYKREGGVRISDLATELGGGACSVENGKATIVTSIRDGDAELTFVDKDGDYINSCAGRLDEVVTIRSAGTYANARRVVETAFADTCNGGCAAAGTGDGGGSQCTTSDMEDIRDAVLAGKKVHGFCNVIAANPSYSGVYTFTGDVIFKDNGVNATLTISSGGLSTQWIGSGSSNDNLYFTCSEASGKAFMQGYLECAGGWKVFVGNEL